MTFTSKCPVCGRFQGSQYLWRPIYDPTPGVNEIRLSPKQAVIYDAVAKRPQTTEMLWTRLYGDDPNGGPCTSIIAVLVNQINKVIRPRGREIRSTSPGYFYRLVNIALPQVTIPRNVPLVAQPPAREHGQPKEQGSNHGTGIRLQPARPSS
jgi:hypothetical protein